VLKHLLGSGATVVVPRKHWHEEVTESESLFLLDQILVGQNLMERPVVKTGYSAQVTATVKEFSGVFSRESQVFGHAAEQLHHLGEMVVVLVVVLSLSGLEQKVTSNHFENSAGE
jgi:uncharacterized protein (DUF362 family)